MTDYSEFFLSSRANVVQLELIEFSHPNFTKVYRIVRNDPDGVTVDLSPSEQGVQFDYFPARFQALGARDDLDSGIRIDIGDVGETVPQEINAVAAAGGFRAKPTVRYWAFRNDALSAPIFGPMLLEVPAVTMTEEGASLEARAPALNTTRTGARYTIDRFPMQRGFQ